MTFVKTDILNPSNREILSTASYDTLIDFLQDKYPVGFGTPTDVSVNGNIINVDDYDMDLYDNDVIVLLDRTALPVGIVGGWFLTALANLAISITLTYIANKLFAPDAPTDSPQPSSVYNINNAQNTARFGSPIPIVYGKVRMYPSMIVQPYYKFENNFEYLYHVLCVGQGKLTTDEIMIGDDVISTTEDLSWKILNQDKFSNIPANGYGIHITKTLSVPSTIELKIADGETEKYKVSADAAYVEYDYMYPNGLILYEKDGDDTSAKTEFIVTLYTELNGVYSPIYTKSHYINRRDINPINYTHRIDISGISEPVYISFRKSLGETTSKNITNTFVKRVKEIYPNEDFTQAYGDVTLLVCKIKATNTITSAGQVKVNGYFTRTDVGNKMHEVLTDIYTNTTYGGGLSASDLNFPVTTEVVNCAYEEQMTVFDAMRRPAIAQGYSVFLAGMEVILKKDEPTSVTTAMFNEMNILRNSLKVQYLFKEEYPDYDGFEVSYIQGDGWIPKTTKYPETSTRPQQVDLFGVVNYGISLTESTGENLSELGRVTASGAQDVKVNLNHAFVVTFSGDGVRAFDISDPANMVEVGSLLDGVNMNGAKSIQIFNNVAFVVSNYSHSIVSIDISDPTNMTLLDVFKSPGNEIYYPEYLALSEDGTKAYVVGSNSVAADIAVIDISNPSNMQAITYITSSTTTVNYGICIVGNLAYLVDAGQDAISIIDLGSQTELGYFSDASLLDGARRIEVKDGVAFVSAYNADKVTAVDVSNPTNMSVIGSIGGTHFNAVFALQIVGNVLFTGSLDSFYLTSAVDISDPANMTEISFMGASGYHSAGLHVVGCKAYYACNSYNRLYSVDVGCIQVSYDDQPAKMAKYLYKQDDSRRKIVSFSTDIQGHIPQFLDKIMVSHSALQWGEAGEVVSRVGDAIVISIPLESLVGSKTIVFRDIDGSVSEALPITVTDATHVTVTGTPAWVTVNTIYTILETGTAKEFTVISVKPSEDSVQIDCVNYDDTIYN